MDTKHVLSACLALFYVSSVFTNDIFNGFLSNLPKYSVVQPQIIHRTKRSADTVGNNDTDESISYLIEINRKKLRLHLQKNRDFLHPDLFSGDESTKVPVHCYYHGEVEGHTDAVVAVSTCYGLRGIIVLEDETYGLEPIPESTSNQHILYRLSDVNSESTTCGVVESEENYDGQAQNQSHFEPGRFVPSLLRKKRNLPTTSYVELALIVDNQRYNFKKKNETAVREEMVETVNLIDGYYKPLNIRVMLVHLEVFKDSNPFSVEGAPGEVLGRFAKWRRENLNPRTRNDVGQFVIGRPGAYGNVLGMAFVGTVCSLASSAGINVFTDTATLSYFSTIVAHEIGHNLGMNHDRDGCVCDGSCIMGAGGGAASFSSCSADDFEKLVLRGGGECLKNAPSHSDVVGIAKCGNGLLEDGEQCDCGTPEECKDKCCDAATCKFTKGSACAAGRCCLNCQLKVAGTPCRRSEDSCDLPEFCLGTSAFCPDDFYLMDGLQCQSGAAYCYEGRCQTYDYQCRRLFSPDPAKKAADICFQTANIKGNEYGNCGRNNKDYIKCPTADVMCGKVQCTNVDANKPPPGGSISNQIVNGTTCVNVHFDLGEDILDPGYSNPGSPCAPGKTCVDFKCVDASVLLPKLNCDSKTTCNGRGVCNNMGHCHCDVGWGPPDCAYSGRGGSVDSGPATIDHSLRNGLLIFFLLVVPLLVVGFLLFLYLFRRETLEPCLKRTHKSRSAADRTSAPAQRSVPRPAHTSTQPPEAPVERVNVSAA
ncbi:disintegrin and metalloproteinase domain-containing protein 9 isoform X2 [Periophthalmus magnuspinnatus]|uniref:disintegrin and metalloproteinase domain-containing protein 9 isoform X2 n=1 Tax=Periophthalmus magnuspinnatus TaxID=409849 RepID=UPI0024364A2E|nr:disintegrin and metalloproteinase domain-containing protein 9 isoform X2 [Periophthalmus magnuspinnatus]